MNKQRDAFGIQWGGDKEIVSATIVEVRVECFADAGTGKSRGAPQYSYTVAATARIAREIADSTRFESGSTRLFGGYKDEMKFQLVSQAGVVLEESSEAVTVSRTDSEFTCSTKFEGLSVDQLKRARGVQAFWTYGD